MKSDTCTGRLISISARLRKQWGCDMYSFCNICSCYNRGYYTKFY